MSVEKRVLKTYGSDLLHYRAEEDGVVYHGYRQNMAPTLSHVAAKNEAVNQYGNKKWQYSGSIPMSMLFDWLKTTNYKMHEFARERKIRQEFIRWLQDRDRRKFIAADGPLAVRHRGVANSGKRIITSE